MQLPFVQRFPVGQITPHPPQFELSVPTSAQKFWLFLLHDWNPGAQPGAHTPAVHISPAPHGLAHLPQLLRSVWTSTQLLAQFVRPAPHIVVQPPLLHTSSAAHVFPHAPQFRGSLSVSTHSVPHADVVPPHARSHDPCEHTSPIAHVRPHAPQFIGSRARTVQLAPQRTAFAPQRPLSSGFSEEHAANPSRASARNHLMSTPHSSSVGSDRMPNRTRRSSGCPS
jgi:hypothetical protein